MRRLLLLVLLVSMPMIVAGCSVVVMDSEAIEGKAGVEVIDVNAFRELGNLIEYARDANGGGELSWEMDTDISQDGPGQVKYHGLYYSISHFMVVEGRIGNSGKLPIIFDTGAPVGAVWVQSRCVVKNNLQIFPIEAKGRTWLGGFCYLPEMQIGNVKFSNLPALYKQNHAEFQMLGLSIGRDESVIVGLPMMKRFKYIKFDNIKKQAEFSLDNVFNCDDETEWSQYNFRIEEYSLGKARLYVEIPIAGKNLELMLDTGSGAGLMINEKLWQELSEGLGDVKLKNGKSVSPFFGASDCKKGIISKLEVGDSIVDKAKVNVFPDDGDFMAGVGHNVIGMQYFRKSVVVLDFERNIMWVTKRK